jgi:predicted AlkP superfamily pyrophosphatase or phosphodiesterase
VRKKVPTGARPTQPHPVLPPGSSHHKVLLIGIDGLRWDRVADAPAPRLRDLAATGLLGTGLLPRDSPAKTMSAPGWSTLVTGVGPAKHGVRDNDFAGRRFDAYPDLFTRAAEARPGLSTYAVVDWPPLVDEGLFGPAISARVRLDGETYGYLPEDLRTTDLSVHVLTEQDPDAAFVYIGCVDRAGHKRGARSAMYRDAIGATDTMVGRLVDAVGARPTYARESWLILIVTDHGHRNWGGHGRRSEVERAIFVVAHGSGVVAGSRIEDFRAVDVVPTALGHLGIRPAPHWQLEGRSLLPAP